jgi:hypothetical protein
MLKAVSFNQGTEVSARESRAASVQLLYNFCTTSVQLFMDYRSSSRITALTMAMMTITSQIAIAFNE